MVPRSPPPERVHGDLGWEGWADTNYRAGRPRCFPGTETGGQKWLPRLQHSAGSAPLRECSSNRAGLLQDPGYPAPPCLLPIHCRLNSALQRQPATCWDPGASASALPTVFPGLRSPPPPLHKPFQGSPALLGTHQTQSTRGLLTTPPSPPPALLSLHPSSTCVAPVMLLLCHAPGTLHVPIPLLGIPSPLLSHTQIYLSPLSRS